MTLNTYMPALGKNKLSEAKKMTRGFPLPCLTLHAKPLESCPTRWGPSSRTTRLLCPWDSPGKNTGGDCHAPPRCLPSPEIEPSSPALAHGFFVTSNTWEAPYLALTSVQYGQWGHRWNKHAFCHGWYKWCAGTETSHLLWGKRTAVPRQPLLASSTPAFPRFCS